MICSDDQGAGMQDAWIRMQRLPGSARAATIGIALVALALGGWALTSGHDAHRVPVAPVLQSETTAGDPAPVAQPDPATDTTTSVVSVVQADGAGSQSMDVSTNSSASAPPADVSATASVEQSSTQSSDGTGSTSTSESVSEHHTSTTSGDGSSSVSVEINKTSSNHVVSSGPDTDSGTTSSVVGHTSSHVGSTAG